MERNHILIVVGILLLSGMATWFVVRSFDERVMLTRQSETLAQKHAESVAAFSDGLGGPGALEGPAEEAVAVEEIEAFIKGLSLIVRGTDDKAVADLFDVQAMFDTLEQLYTPRNMQERQTVRKGFRAGLQKGTRKMTRYMNWQTSQVRKVRFLAGHHEAMVYSRHTDDNGIRIKMRWWLVRRDHVWRIYDYEDLDTGLRSSALMAAALNATLSTGSKGTGWPFRVAEIRAAIAAIHDEDHDTARAHLTGLANAGFPPMFESVRLMLLGGVAMATEQFEEALSLLDKAQALNADMPIIYWLRANAMYQLGEYEKVPEQVAKYEAMLGADAEVHLTLGLSLLLLERKEEAAVAFRKGLRDDPEAMENLVGLCTAVGRAGTEEIRACFKAAADKNTAFTQVAQSLHREYEMEALEAAVDAFRPLNGEHPMLEEKQGIVDWHHKRYDQAAAAMKLAIAASRDDAERADRIDSYHGIMIDAGKSLEAYLEATDRIAAFESLMDWFDVEDASAQVRQALITEHEKHHPDDVMLPFHRAELHYLQDNVAQAEAQLTLGYALNLDELQRERYRYRLITARYETGKAISAYQEIGPRDDTFQQLAQAARHKEDHKTLDQLIELHRPHSKGPQEMAMWEAISAMLQKDHARAATLLVTHREAIAKSPEWDWRFKDYLIRSLIRAGRFDEARAELAATPEEDRSIHHQAAVAAVSGNAPLAIRIMENAIKEYDYRVHYFHDDEDLGPVLQTDAYKAFREAYPE